MAVLRLLYTIRRLMGFTQWQRPVPQHHEDPLTMTTVEKLYLGYKYYYKAMVQDEAGTDIAAHFRDQSLQPQLPDDFTPEETITLSLGGDLIPYDSITKENCEDIWEEAGEYFFNNDIVFANLETVADPGKPYSAAPEVMLADMYFNVQEETFDIFSGNGKYKGFSVLGTANNHSMDGGREGIMATQHFLRSKNIAYTGTALSQETRNDFPIIERGGIKIAFLAYTYSLNKETLPAGEAWLCNHILLNKKDADISLLKTHALLARQRGAHLIVASLHMGCAYQVYPQQYTVENMHRICRETGIDILVGGHPHNAQPMELFTTFDAATQRQKEHVIIYSLGDFIANDIYKWCHLPLIVKLSVSRGNTGGKEAVLVSGIQVKPFYFYQNKKGALKLVDFLNAEKNIGERFPEKHIQKEVRELSDFFHRFIITAKQQQVLG